MSRKSPSIRPWKIVRIDGSSLGESAFDIHLRRGQTYVNIFWLYVVDEIREQHVWFYDGTQQGWEMAVDSEVEELGL